MSKQNAYVRYFGKLTDLAEQLPWTEGVANIYEHVSWYTAAALGVTKTEYWKTILKWNEALLADGISFDDRVKAITAQLQCEINRTEAEGPYDKPISGFVKPYEALRRQRFFAEEYLNKEFDIFMSLASDAYLTKLYGDVFGISGGGKWSAHGNGGRFQVSTMSDMQIDNLVYNADMGVLVANELKLGGQKNPDQILKYAHLFRTLHERELVAPDTRFHLLLISDSSPKADWLGLIDAEFAKVSVAGKGGSLRDKLLCSETLAMARSMSKASITWLYLKEFNAQWLLNLHESQSVEQKLVAGFNSTLDEKWHLRK